ncbi:hypothetical protein ACJRO7_011625 [Eucalyptus globulus]|uniref:Thioredoxin domain-containing protein n=1 Tax=Eucalyptus globulus TaxID=34317 RepID=A0ABD3LFS7_EUCGL
MSCNFSHCYLSASYLLLLMKKCVSLSLYSFTLVEAKKQTYKSFDYLLAKSEKPLLIVKIDIKKYPNIAEKYKIEASPTFFIFKDGKPFEHFTCPHLEFCSSVQQLHFAVKCKV